MMEYGSKIYELRKAKNLSQEEVANLLYISRQSISLWETNQASPSMENLISLAKLFSVSLDELVGISQTTKRISEEADFIITYYDTKSIIYRRDYKYIKDWKEALRFFVFTFFFTFGLSFLIGSFSIMIRLNAIGFFLISLVFLLGAYLIYPRYILKNIKNILNMEYEYNLSLYKSYLSYNKKNHVKSELFDYEYKYFDYYTERSEYIILYLLKGDPIYIPISGNQKLKEFISLRIEKRTRPKTFWNNR